MTAVFVEDKETPTPLPRLAVALRGGHRRVMGSEFLSVRSMALGLAQLRLESGNGQKAHRCNYHNEKLGSDWDGYFTQFKCDELFEPATAAYCKRLDPAHCIVTEWPRNPQLRRCVLLAGHPWSRFVAFVQDEQHADPAEEQGAGRYVDFLADRERYRAAWHALRLGDAVAFASELHAAGYFTAELETYARGLVRLTEQSLELCETVLEDRTEKLDDAFVANVIALGQEALAQNVLWLPDRHDLERAA